MGPLPGNAGQQALQGRFAGGNPVAMQQVHALQPRVEGRVFGGAARIRLHSGQTRGGTVNKDARCPACVNHGIGCVSLTAACIDPECRPPLALAPGLAPLFRSCSSNTRKGLREECPGTRGSRSTASTRLGPAAGMSGAV